MTTKTMTMTRKTAKPASRRRLTFGQIVELIPTRPGGGYKGSWIGFFLRAVFAPIIGLDNARKLVIDSIGPGHDYFPLKDGHEEERVRCR